MKKTQNEGSERSKEDLRAWMQAHPREYGEFALEMGEADLLERCLMSEAAFAACPEFKQRLEEMIDTDSLDVNELLAILQKSDLAEIVFTKPTDDKEVEEGRLPLATWLKYGRTPEMVIENIEDAITLTDNQQAKWQLSKFLKDVMKRLVGAKKRSRKELSEYIDYRKNLENGNIAEWALNGVDEHDATTGNEDPIKDWMELLVSENKQMIERIGGWLRQNCRGIDVARLYVAFMETEIISGKVTVTEFLNAICKTFPDIKLVGTRQVQKDVNVLQSLFPNSKRYGKDDPENRFAIDSIKTEILQIASRI